MKIETKKSENYSSVFFRINLPFTNKVFRIYSLLYNKPNAWVHGYSARCEDSRFVLFMDFDSMPYVDLINELQFLQNKYHLGDFIIFKLDREDSFHAVCLDKFSMIEVYEILKDSSVDFAFTNSIKNLQTRAWVLRWGDKGSREAPKYQSTLFGKFRKREQSNAHRLFIEKLGVPVEDRGRWDKFTQIQMVKYDTANRIVKEE